MKRATGFFETMKSGFKTWQSEQGETITNWVEGFALGTDLVGNQLDNLLGVMREAGMEQKGIFKAMFIVSKAFHIAQAIIATEAAAAQALAIQPAFIGMALAGVVRALGYASVGIMTGMAIAGFEGGGMTPNGPRSGGMDGRGGKLAVLHPNEKILDLRNGDSSGTKIVINNYDSGSVNATASASPEGIVTVAVRLAVNAVASDLNRGRGPVSQALESMGNVRRGI